MGFGQGPSGVGHFCSPIIRPLVRDRLASADALPPASKPTRKGFVFASVCIGREFSENAIDRAIDSATGPIHPGVINRVLTVVRKEGFLWDEGTLAGFRPWRNKSRRPRPTP